MHLRHVSLGRGGWGRNDSRDGGPARHYQQGSFFFFFLNFPPRATQSLRLEGAGLTLQS